MSTCIFGGIPSIPHNCRYPFQTPITLQKPKIVFKVVVGIIRAQTYATLSEVALGDAVSICQLLFSQDEGKLFEIKTHGPSNSISSVHCDRPTMC